MCQSRRGPRRRAQTKQQKAREADLLDSTLCFGSLLSNDFVALVVFLMLVNAPLRVDFTARKQSIHLSATTFLPHCLQSHYQSSPPPLLSVCQSPPICPHPLLLAAAPAARSCRRHWRRLGVRDEGKVGGPGDAEGARGHGLDVAGDHGEAEPVVCRVKRDSVGLGQITMRVPARSTDAMRCGATRCDAHTPAHEHEEASQFSFIQEALTRRRWARSCSPSSSRPTGPASPPPTPSAGTPRPVSGASA